MRAYIIFGWVLLLALLSGCTSRGITVTSTPPGAEVSINRRVVGRTPYRVNFTHYGVYRIELRKGRYETLVRDEHILPPWYGYDPATVIADNVVPAHINDETFLHYVMAPVAELKENDRKDLLERARAARDGHLTHPETGKHLDLGPFAALSSPEKFAPGEKTTLEAPAKVATPPSDLKPTAPSELKPVSPEKVTPPAEPLPGTTSTAPKKKTETDKP